MLYHFSHSWPSEPWLLNHLSHPVLSSVKYPPHIDSIPCLRLQYVSAPSVQLSLVQIHDNS